MITQSFSSPMLAEGIGAFTSQFKKGGMTNKNKKKKLSKAEMDLIQMYAEGGEVTKKDTYEVGDKIKYMDTFRREENDGTIYQINELGTYIVSTGMGVRGVKKEEVIGVYPKEEPKKKRFGLFAKGGEVYKKEKITVRIDSFTDSTWFNASYNTLRDGYNDVEVLVTIVSKDYGFAKMKGKYAVIETEFGEISGSWKNKHIFDTKEEAINFIKKYADESEEYAKGGSVGNARTKGRESQNWEQRLKEYAGKNYNTLTAKEKEEIIADMKKSYDRNYSYAKGGNVSTSDKRFVLEVRNGETNELLEERVYRANRYSTALLDAQDDEEFFKKKYGDYLHFELKEKYAKGGSTDPKPSAQDILKRLGYNIPEPEGQEEEPKIIRGWVDDEPYYFAKGGMSKDDSPKVYIADLMEYNNGRLVGKWFDLTDYSDASELMEDIQAMLDEQTKKDRDGEVHEEWAVHDYENFPRSMYSEYMGEEDFQKIIEVIQGAEESNLPFDIILEAMSDLGVDEISEVVERYNGSVEASMGNEWRDFAYEYVDSVGGVSGVSNANYYFDFEAFGRDERINMGGEAEEEMGYEDLTDEQLGEQLVDEIGGVGELSESTIDMYFDYDKFGRELQYDFTSIRGEDGDYYFFNSNYKKGGKLKSKPKSDDDGEYELSEEEKKIIRGYVDDEPYYFAEGGEVTMDEKKKSLKGQPKLKF